MCPEMKSPLTPYANIRGVCYLPRMLDKIRLMHSGELHQKYHGWYGKGMDERCADFFRVAFSDIEAKVEEGLSDDDVFAWLQRNGREINENDIDLWNGFMMKRGWRDSMTEMVAEDLAERGWRDRSNIVTLFDFYVADEGRPAYGACLSRILCESLRPLAHHRVSMMRPNAFP